VGALSFLLASHVIRPRLRRLKGKVHEVADAIDQATFADDWSSCRLDTCRVPVESSDELGLCAESFNRLLEALFNSRELEQGVSDFSATLSTELELEPLSEDALGQLIRHSDAIAGALLVEKEGELAVAASRAFREPKTLPANDHVRAAFRSLESQHLSLPAGLNADGLVGEVEPREVLVLPIRYKGLCIGLVVLATAGTFGAQSRRVLDLFSSTLGLALHNALTYDQLQRTAALDPLTSAYNRRFGMGRLSEELSRATRSGDTFGLIMFDIDHFKSVNDTYGHLTGDHVLVEVTHACRRVLREGDVAVRYGGEEFFIILPGASLADSSVVAERIRHSISDTRIQDGQQRIHVTVSCGVTAFPQDPIDSAQQLLHHADEAMYEAKQAGRNQVKLAIAA